MLIGCQVSFDNRDQILTPILNLFLVSPPSCLHLATDIRLVQVTIKEDIIRSLDPKDLLSHAVFEL